MDVHEGWRGGSVGKGTCSQVQFPRLTGREERTDSYKAFSDLGRSALNCRHTHKQINYLNGYEHVLRILKQYGYRIHDDGRREELDTHLMPLQTGWQRGSKIKPHFNNNKNLSSQGDGLFLKDWPNPQGNCLESGCSHLQAQPTGNAVCLDSF